MSHYADDTYDVYVEVKRKARKEHLCCACSEKIRIGDEYSVTKAVFEGTVRTYKRCLRCQKIHKHLRDVCNDRASGEMWPDEELNCGEEYKDHWGVEPPEEIAALAFALPGEVK